METSFKFVKKKMRTMSKTSNFGRNIQNEYDWTNKKVKNIKGTNLRCNT